MYDIHLLSVSVAVAAVVAVSPPLLSPVAVEAAAVSSSESHPSIASKTSESSPCSSSIANLSYSVFANRSHSLKPFLKIRINYKKIMVILTNNLETLLFGASRRIDLEFHRL